MNCCKDDNEPDEQYAILYVLLIPFTGEFASWRFIIFTDCDAISVKEILISYRRHGLGSGLEFVFDPRGWL